MSLRIIHVSDLHLGKKMSMVPIEEDQREVLSFIADLAERESADAVLIAGDIYDSTTPANESYNLLSGFLTDLADRGVKVYAVAGNHDSADKISYGSDLFRRCGVHIVGSYAGTLEMETLVGKDGTKVDVYMLPFVRPAAVRNCHPDARIETYTDAVRTALGTADLSGPNRKVLIAHQYVTCGGGKLARADSESFVGGMDNVDVSLFDGFDYVALGHIHMKQWVGRETVRYCGTPLKYSKSEADGGKTVTVVDIGEEISIREVPIVPRRDVLVIRGPLDRLIDAAKEIGGSDDFIYAELTDQAVDAMQRLREVYPNTLSVTVVTPEQGNDDFLYSDEVYGDDTDVREEFARFFSERTGRELTEEQKKMVDAGFEEVGL